MTSWLMAPLIACLVLAAVQLGLAIRAVLLEKREGLRVSKRRLISASIIFGAVLGLLLTSQLHFEPTPRAPKVEVKKDDPKLAELRQQEAELTTKLEAVRAEISKLDPQADVLSLIPGEEILNSLVWRVMVAGLLVIVGFLLLLWLGDPATLIPERWFWWRDKAVEDAFGKATAGLNKLAAAAADGRYEEGLKLAAEVREDLLDQVDQLDLLFLRSYCTVQIATGLNGELRREKLQAPLRELPVLLERAPNLAHAEYLLAMARSLMGEFKPALDGFRKAKQLGAPSELPFAHNESACLLALAEEQLGKGDTAAASKLFEEATSLGVLKDSVPVVLVENQLLQLRTHLSKGNLVDARGGLASLQAVQGLSEEQSKFVKLMASALSILIEFREGNLDETLSQVQKFLTQVQPANLPPADEQAADEYLEPAVPAKELPVRAELYRAFYFLEAVVLAKLSARKGSVLTNGDAREIAQRLLRALQFEPRHREVLGALGVLTYWTQSGQRAKALEWMEAAVSMGVRSRIVRRMLERNRLLETERQSLLERFSGVAARFLNDPAVTAQVRRALVQELGRFEDFQPLLVDLDQMGDQMAQAPTLQTLRERALYIDELAREVTQRSDQSGLQKLHDVRQEYRRLVEMLDSTSSRLTDLDQLVLTEVGRAVMA